MSRRISLWFRKATSEKLRGRVGSVEVSGNVQDGPEGSKYMKMKNFAFKIHHLLSTITLMLCGVLLNLGLWQYADCAPAYQIGGFYLGATPEDIGVTVEVDPGLAEKYHEVEKGDVRLFFVLAKGKLRLYRIVKEEAIKSDNMQTVLDGLKRKYGAPDRQQIRTSSARPKYQKDYNITVKNRALWNINESQEFIAEVESKRVIYELIDHDPGKIKSIRQSDATGDEGFTIENWNPDY